jgi:hypothetical protein
MGSHVPATSDFELIVEKLILRLHENHDKPEILSLYTLVHPRKYQGSPMKYVTTVFHIAPKLL